VADEMNPRTAAVSRTQKSNGIQREGPNWVLIAGGALLSTLSFRLGYKLKQATDKKQADDSGNSCGNLAFFLKFIFTSSSGLILNAVLTCKDFMFRKWKIH